MVKEVSVLLLFLVLWSNVCFSSSREQLIDAECLSNIKVSGSGWDDPSVILPSRYFFIHVPDNCNLTISLVVTSLKKDRECLIKTKVFSETATGVVIVRYRLISKSCNQGISMTIYNKNQVLKKKEFSFPVYGEDCVCRSNHFIEQLRCHEDIVSREGVARDLKTWKESHGNFTLWLQEAVKRFASFPRSYSFCHYKILSNEIYRKCYGEYIGFNQFFDAMLKSLLRKTSIADTQFLVNLGDWPLSSKSQYVDNQLLPIPFFSWCGSDDTHDIVVPTYEMTESVLYFQDRVSVDVLSVMGKQSVSFEEKLNKIFFRGRDSNRIRLLLVLFSKENPEVIDAGLTNFFFFREESELKKYGPKVPHVPLYDFFKYKYLVSIDGTVAAYRLPSLLAGSSLVLKQKSKYYEHFYPFLEANKHYIELKDDISNFYDILSRLMNESDSNHIPLEGQKSIIKEANEFLLNHLLPGNIYCYYYQAITQYTLLLNPDSQRISIEEEDEKVENSKDLCECENQNLRNDATKENTVKEEL